MLGRLTILLVVVLALGLAACGDDGGDDGGFTVYSGRAGALIGPLIDRYEEREGIDIEVRFGETAELASTILEEGRNSPADLFYAQDAGALGALQDAELLAPLPPAALREVSRRYRSAAGRWVATSARSRIVAYDKRELEPSDLPRSILDFTDEKWKGRIGWAPTNGSFQAFVTALRLMHGEDRAREWLKGIEDNDPVVFANNNLIRDAIADGEIDVGFINHYYVAQAVAAEGDDYPVGIYQPPGGDIGSLVNVAGVGILESSGRKPAVRRFVRFLLGAEAQRYFAEKTFEYPVVSGVPANRSLTPLNTIKHPDVDLTQIDDLQGTIELLQETGVL